MFLFFFNYPALNKSNIHTSIIGTENGRNYPFSSTVFYFKNKIIEGGHQV